MLDDTEQQSVILHGQQDQSLQIKMDDTQAEDQLVVDINYEDKNRYLSKEKKTKDRE